MNFEHIFARIHLLGGQFFVARQTGLVLGLAAGRIQTNPFQLALQHFLARRMLLVLRGGHRLLGFQPFLVVALEGIAAPGIHFQNPFRHVIQEIAVVRHHHQRAAELFEIFLQPRDRFGVEVIGRLVQQQRIRIGQQQTAQRHASLFAARKRAHIRVARRQPQRVHGALDLVVQTPQIARINQILQPPQLVIDLFGFLRAHVFAQLAAQLVIAVQDGLRGRRAIRHVAGHVLRLVQLRLLRQIPHANARRDDAFTVIILVQPGNNFQQRRFARAVPANNTNFCAEEKGQRDVVQHRLVVVLLGQMSQIKNIFACHGNS